MASTHPWRTPVRIALAGAIAVSASGCLADRPAHFGELGTGFGHSATFRVGEGPYRVGWTASDAATPRDGCLFGLLLDPVDVVEPFDVPKLEYQTVDGGKVLTGRADLDLLAGTYQFVIEGSCMWTVRVDPTSG